MNYDRTSINPTRGVRRVVPTIGIKEIRSSVFNSPKLRDSKSRYQKVAPTTTIRVATNVKARIARIFSRVLSVPPCASLLRLANSSLSFCSSASTVSFSTAIPSLFQSLSSIEFVSYQLAVIQTQGDEFLMNKLRSRTGATSNSLAGFRGIALGQLPRTPSRRSSQYLSSRQSGE